MCQYQLKYIFFFLLIVFTPRVFAQTSTVSNPLSGRINEPYSRYGIGEFWNSNNTLLKGMGDITSAYADPYAINIENPASLGFLKLTTYEAGADFENHTLSTNDLSYNTGTGTLSYMNIAMPVSKHFGFCIGIKPISHVYYSLADTTTGGNDTLIGKQVIHDYVGSGALNYLFVGAAAKFGGFSIGITAGYLFGNITTTDRLVNNDTTAAYSSAFEQVNKIGGIYWKGGLMYETQINKKYTLRLGGTFSLQQSLNITHNEYWIASYSLPDTFIADTTYAAKQASGTLVMPMSFSFGVQLAKGEQWLVGLDYTSTQWNQFRNLGATDSVASQTSKISLGGQYTPNAISTRNYWSRVSYRMGIYYGTNYVYLQNTTLNTFGVTLGASLPFKKSHDRLHFAFDYGKTGNRTNGLIQDNYFKFSVGASLNDKWFIKRRYE